MAAVAGLRGTGDWGTDERPKNFREMILFRNPNGAAPIFALMSRIAEEEVDDPEFSWWDEPNDHVRLQVNGALTNVATTVVVDSADPDASVPDRSWGLATHLKPGDLLLVERDGVAEPAAWANEIIRVVSITNTTTFVVTRGQAGTTAAAIEDNSFLTLIGSAYGEGTAAPDATSRNPIKYSNFCQIWKNAYELTNTARKTKARTGQAEANDKKRKIFDHSRGIELSILFGSKFEGTDTNNKPIRFMGGLREFIPASNTTIFGATTNLTQYLNATTPLFNWDTPAGNERIAFCGNGYLNNINHLARINGQIRFDGQVKVFGMDLQKFVLPQGTIFFKSHPLLSRHGRYTNSAFYMDFSALKYRPLRDTKADEGPEGKGIQLPGQDSKKGQWITEAGIEVKYGGLTLGYHGNFLAAA